MCPTMIIISRRRMCRQTDTYIAKDSAINEEIDKLRLSATAALVERRDVIVVAIGFLYLWSGQPGGLPWHDGIPAARAWRRTGTRSSVR